MIEIEITFLVEKPIDQVFALIADVPNYRRWATEQSGFFVENKITSEGPLGLGMTYMDTLKWGGKAIGKIVKYEPPTSITFQQKMVFGLPVFDATIDYALKSSQSFTEVTHKLTAVPCGLFKLAKSLLSSIIRSERERTCKAVKQTMEQERQPPE